MLRILAIIVISVIIISPFGKVFGQNKSASKLPLVRTEFTVINEVNPFVDDLPRVFAQRINTIGQARPDAAFVHTIFLTNNDCAIVLNAKFEISATALNRGARNDRIGTLRRGLAIRPTSLVWTNSITINQTRNFEYQLSPQEIKSLNETGRITIAIQDDTRIDSAKLIFTRDYSRCRNNSIS